jgi:hypothetical protein
MYQQRIIYGLFILTLYAQAGSSCLQKTFGAAQSATPSNLNVSVDEVSLTFHAADVHGLPIGNIAGG